MFLHHEDIYFGSLWVGTDIRDVGSSAPERDAPSGEACGG